MSAALKWNLMSERDYLATELELPLSEIYSGAEFVPERDDEEDSDNE